MRFSSASRLKYSPPPLARSNDLLYLRKATSALSRHIFSSSIFALMPHSRTKVEHNKVPLINKILSKNIHTRSIINSKAKLTIPILLLCACVPAESGYQPYRDSYKINACSQAAQYSALAGESYSVENCMNGTSPVESPEYETVCETTPYGTVKCVSRPK